MKQYYFMLIWYTGSTFTDILIIIIIIIIMIAAIENC